MKNQIIQYLNQQGATLNIQEIFLSFVVALILGGMIFIAYRFSHSNVMYNGRFNVSLVMLTLITTLVMNVIGNNVALSLGMVGALSIVRFRTAIKDPRDTTYIFWCIAVGICCGVQSFMLAFIGSGFIFMAMLILGAIKSNNRYLLIVEVDQKDMSALEKEITVYYQGKAVLSVQNSSASTVEYIYEISEKLMQKANKVHGKTIAHLLNEKMEIKRLSLVSQSDEMSR